MANMPESQIKTAIDQMELMAKDPEMVKMAADQMKNMDEKQFESFKEMLRVSDGASSSSSDPAAQLPADPSKMMEALLSNPEQCRP